MLFDIEIGERVHRVSVEREGARYRIVVDGRADVVDAARVDSATLSLIVVGERHESHEVALLERGEPGALEVHLRAGVVAARVRPAGSRRGGAQAPGGPGGPVKLTAPMPRKIVKVLVSPGDEVGPRQGLVVVEAMKMENELRAPRQGRVASVHVQEGALVEAGRLLLVIE